MELKKRSIAKSITYRIICIISQTIITYVFIRDIATVTGVVLTFQLIQILLYYLHERMWSKTKWGYE